MFNMCNKVQELTAVSFKDVYFFLLECQLFIDHNISTIVVKHYIKGTRALF